MRVSEWVLWILGCGGVVLVVGMVIFQMLGGGVMMASTAVSMILTFFGMDYDSTWPVLTKIFGYVAAVVVVLVLAHVAVERFRDRSANR